jgi:hypothetical protein
MRLFMKHIVLFITAPLMLVACASTELTMSLGNMRLINSSADPQQVMDYANKICRDDFYIGASFISKAGKDYRFKCVRALVPIPGLKPNNTK